MANGEVFELVAGDIRAGLGHMFGPDPDADPPVIVNRELDDDGALIGNERIAALPWIYFCVHDGDFEGLFRTDRRLEIHGVTFVDNRQGGESLLHRYVDWMGVATQLGLEVSWRVPVDEEQYRRGRHTDEG